MPFGRSRIRPLQHWSQLTDSPAVQVPKNQQSESSILWWMTLDNLYKGVPLGTVVIDEYLFMDSSIRGWGAHMGNLQASGLWSRALRYSHINLLELHDVGAPSLFQCCQCCHHVGQHVHSCLLEKSGGGTRSQQMCDLALQVCRWAESHQITLIPRHIPGHLNAKADYLSRKCQISKTEWSLNQVVADDFPPLKQSTCGLICSNGEQKTGYLHVPNSGDSSLESRQPSAVLGRSLCLCIPSNSPNQIMSKQDQIGQSRGHPDCTILAEPGEVSRPRGLVNRFSNNPSPNEDSPQTVILPPVSSTTSIAEPSRMVIISGYIEQRGFSKQVSQRLSVPQRKSTSEVYDGKWKVCRQWCQQNSRIPALPVFREKAQHIHYQGISLLSFSGHECSRY